jgi:hypothetical protein
MKSSIWSSESKQGDMTYSRFSPIDREPMHEEETDVESTVPFAVYTNGGKKMLARRQKHSKAMQANEKKMI